MPQLDSDSFTYSNGNLATASSAKWTKLSGFNDLVVTSNKVSGSGDAGDVITSFSGSSTDQYGQVVLSTAASDGGPTVRSNATSTFYLLDVNGGSTPWTIFRVVSGAFTDIGGASTMTTNNGDTAYLEMQGTTLVAKQNNTTIITVTPESTIASGKPGMWISGTSLIVDDWAAGDFSAGGPTAAQILPALIEGLSGNVIGRVDA